MEGGCSQFVHNRSRMTIDSRIPSGAGGAGVINGKLAIKRYTVGVY